MKDWWKEKDAALICEASKLHPDFNRMEQFLKDGANVNAVESDGEENLLSQIILDHGRDTEDGDNGEQDSLQEVVRFFLDHGFNPGADDGRAGAKCLVNMCWSACMSSKIPVVRMLLDAGFQDIPEDEDSNESDERLPSDAIATKASYLHTCEHDFVSANIFEAMWQMIEAKKESRHYHGIDRFETAYGRTLLKVWVSKPKSGEPFFDLDRPRSKHRNCFKDNLFFQVDGGYLYLLNGAYMIFNTEPPQEELTDATERFAFLVGYKIRHIRLSRNEIRKGSTIYGQTITEFCFENDMVLRTQDNFGEEPTEETVTYYSIG